MALEIELKLRVDRHEVVRDALKARGARHIGRRLETNTFLDTPDNTLLSSGAGLRVRQHRNLDTGEIDAVITHKGPRRPGAMKIREETEIGISSYGGGVRLLQELGYGIRLSFEKRREIWRLGDCEVVLDELPGGLGLFVEIEGPDEKAVNRVRTQLGLSAAPVEPSGYAVLVARHLQAIGQSTLSFS